MDKEIKAIPKNKKCRCGRKITHHHFLCNNCWISDSKDRKLLKKHMNKVKKKGGNK